jgi:hypothetical protein
MLTLPPQLQSFITHHSSGTFRRNPERDWGIALALAALVLVAIFGWNLWLFDTVVSGKALGEVAPVDTLSVNKSSLEAIQNLFTGRAAEEARYVDGTYQFTDPSE